MVKHRKIKPLALQEKILTSGLTFHQETFHLNKRFTNLYWLKINSTKYKFTLKTCLNPQPLINYQVKNKKIVAGINFASFYLSDEKNKPKNFFYNLLLSKGNVLQFPSNTRTAIIIKNGQLNHKRIKSRGTIKINNQIFSWSGLYTNRAADIIVYTPFNIEIKKHRTGSKIKRQIYKNSDSVTCPQNHLLLGCDLKNNTPFIKTISNKKLSLTQFSFILQGHKNKLENIKAGNKLNDFRLDNHNFSTKEDICSASFLLGKTKNQLIDNLKRELVYPKGKISKPLEKNYLKSWSVILKEKNNVIFFINDTRPKIENQTGISTFELQKILKQKFDYSWAIVGDSGQSSKLLLNHKTKKIFGNLHYLNYKTNPPSWDGIKGRSIPTAILAYE